MCLSYLVCCGSKTWVPLLDPVPLLNPAVSTPRPQPPKNSADELHESMSIMLYWCPGEQISDHCWHGFPASFVTMLNRSIETQWPCLEESIQSDFTSCCRGFLFARNGGGRRVFLPGSHLTNDFIDLTSHQRRREVLVRVVIQ
jgi:hypothetical protein